MIPDYQTIMLLVLELVADGKEYQLNDLVDALSIQF